MFTATLVSTATETNTDRYPAEAVEGRSLRHYLIGSWSNADEYDYSGEQLMGDRTPGRSVEIDKVMPHVLPNGKANLERYRDAPEKQAKAIPKTIKEKIVPQEATLDKLDAQEIELHQAYERAEVDDETFDQLLYALRQKRERAWKSRCKALGLPTEEEDYSDGYIEDEELSSYTPVHQQQSGSAAIKPMPTKVFFALVAVCAVMLLILSN